MMNTDTAVGLDRPPGSAEPSRALRRWWAIVATSLLAAAALQAILAGLMLSGVPWARGAHNANAILLIVAAAAAALASLLALRRTPHGPRLAFSLLWLAAAVFFQAAAGALSAKGVNLLWLHVPLGVAVIGLAAHATAAARRLGGE